MFLSMWGREQPLVCNRCESGLATGIKREVFLEDPLCNDVYF